MSPVRPTVTVVGRRLDPADYRLRDFLTRAAQPYEWVEAGRRKPSRSSRGTGRPGSTCPSSSTARRS